MSKKSCAPGGSFCEKGSNAGGRVGDYGELTEKADVFIMKVSVMTKKLRNRDCEEYFAEGKELPGWRASIPGDFARGGWKR